MTEVFSETNGRRVISTRVLSPRSSAAYIASRATASSSSFSKAASSSEVTGKAFGGILGNTGAEITPSFSSSAAPVLSDNKMSSASYSLMSRIEDEAAVDKFVSKLKDGTEVYESIVADSVVVEAGKDSTDVCDVCGLEVASPDPPVSTPHHGHAHKKPVFGAEIKIFDVKIEKPEGQMLGMRSTPSGEYNRRISFIHEGGIVDLWNKANPESAIKVGDHITGVNGLRRKSSEHLANALSKSGKIHIELHRGMYVVPLTPEIEKRDPDEAKAKGGCLSFISGKEPKADREQSPNRVEDKRKDEGQVNVKGQCWLSASNGDTSLEAISEQTVRMIDDDPSLVKTFPTLTFAVGGEEYIVPPEVLKRNLHHSGKFKKDILDEISTLQAQLQGLEARHDVDKNMVRDAETSIAQLKRQEFNVKEECLAANSGRDQEMLGMMEALRDKLKNAETCVMGYEHSVSRDWECAVEVTECAEQTVAAERSCAEVREAAEKATSWALTETSAAEQAVALTYKLQTLSEEERARAEAAEVLVLELQRKEASSSAKVESLLAELNQARMELSSAGATRASCYSEASKRAQTVLEEARAAWRVEMDQNCVGKEEAEYNALKLQKALDVLKEQSVQDRLQIAELKDVSQNESGFFKTEVRRLQSEVDEFLSFKEQADAEIASLRTNLEIKDKGPSRLGDARVETTPKLLEAEVTRLQAEVTRLKEEAENAKRAELDKFFSVKSDAENGKRFQAEVVRLQAELTQLKAAKDAAEALSRQLQKDLDTHIEEAGSVQLCFEEQKRLQKAELSTLKVQVGRLQAELEEKSRKQTADFSLLKDSAAGTQVLQLEVSRLETELSNTRSDMAELRIKAVELATVQAENMELKRCNIKMKDWKEEVARLQNEVAQLKSKLTVTEAQVASGEPTKKDAELAAAARKAQEQEATSKVLREELERSRVRIEIAESKALEMQRRVMVAEAEALNRSPGKLQSTSPEPEPTSPQSIGKSSASSFGKKQLFSVDASLSHAEMEAWRKRQKDAADLARLEATNWLSRAKPIGNVTEVVEEEIIAEIAAEARPAKSKLLDTKSSLQAFRREIESVGSPSSVTEMKATETRAQSSFLSGTRPVDPVPKAEPKKQEMSSVDFEFAKMVKKMGGRGANALKADSYLQKNYSNGELALTTDQRSMLDESDAWRRRKLEALNRESEASASSLEVSPVERSLPTPAETMSNDDFLLKFATSGPVTVRKGTDLDRRREIVEVDTELVQGPASGGASLRLQIADRNEAYAQAKLDSYKDLKEATDEEKTISNAQGTTILLEEPNRGVESAPRRQPFWQTRLMSRHR